MDHDVTHVRQQLFPDGRVIDCDEQWTLEQLQAFVGGWIDIIPSRLLNRALVINDEGVLEDLPVNPLATALARPGTLMLDGIRGNVLVITDQRD